MEDKTIPCVDCGQEFIFTEGEQEYYKTHKLYPPKRCKECRDKKRAERQAA